MNWWLIVIACIFAILILGISVYIVVIYVAENDRTSAWFPKAVVVFGLSLACTTVLLLPYDVANRKDPEKLADYGGGLDTALMWQIVLWMTASFVVVIIPFTTFFYEAYDPDQASSLQQVGPALMYTFILVVFFGVLTAILWITIGYADLPYWSYTCPPQYSGPFDVSLVYYNGKRREILQLTVSIFVYVVGLMIGIGWFFFCIYGGVGLVALPVDQMTDFMNRPRPMNKQQIQSAKNKCLARATALFSRAEELQKRGAPGRSTRNAINAMRGEVMVLEKEVDKVKAAETQTGTGPIFAALLVGLALIGGILSLMWLMHIFLYNATGVNPFLNTFLVQLDSAFGLLGTAAYALFAFYLLLASVKGCFKVGLRLVFFQIHPMKIGDTLMNAMLFNVGLVLLLSVVVVQFCTLSFNIYASNTSIDGLLNLWVRRLHGIGDAMFYFQFAFVAVAIISIFWVILCPRSKVKASDKDDDDDDDE